MTEITYEGLLKAQQIYYETRDYSYPLELYGPVPFDFFIEKMIQHKGRVVVY